MESKQNPVFFQSRRVRYFRLQPPRMQLQSESTQHFVFISLSSQKEYGQQKVCLFSSKKAGSECLRLQNANKMNPSFAEYGGLTCLPVKLSFIPRIGEVTLDTLQGGGVRMNNQRQHRETLKGHISLHLKWSVLELNKK